MANSSLVRNGIYKLQIALLEGIQDENLLFAAGRVMSCTDYEDVVVERSIGNLCGYPLCRNSLPSDRPRKGRYRISLKEHKVYDLHETYSYCSSACMVDSRAFAESLKDDIASVFNPQKLDEVLRLFGSLNVDFDGSLEKEGNSGSACLRIQEKADVKAGEFVTEAWRGRSDAIEGYVPKTDFQSQPSTSKVRKKATKQLQGSEDKSIKLGGVKDFYKNELDFTSIIMIDNEYSISKVPKLKEAASEGTWKLQNEKDICKKLEEPSMALGTSSIGTMDDSEGTSMGEISQDITNDADKKMEKALTSNQCPTDCIKKTEIAENNSHVQKGAAFSDTVLRSSFKQPGMKKCGRHVRWIDEKTDGFNNTYHSEVREIENARECSEKTWNKDAEINDHMLSYVSAEACAVALSQAADAVANGECESIDAASQAGIIILPPPNDTIEEASADVIKAVDSDSILSKWPKKSGSPQCDLFNPDDSWYDAPPEGFHLRLSPFATMWTTLFSWITSSSLAYIYGRDESSHEEYMSINGREYPMRTVLGDGRSYEIKQTLAGYLARYLPGLVTALRLSTSLSSLEQGMIIVLACLLRSFGCFDVKLLVSILTTYTGYLLDTFTLIDALPAFKVKQWQVILLLFMEALSVCRIPSLTTHMANKRTLLHMVLDGAHIRVDEYEVMKDLIIPLGRTPKFSVQSGA